MASRGVGPFSGQRLRLARFRASLTARELAERVGVTPSAISQFETGRAKPTAAVAAALALACGVPVAYFDALGRQISPNGMDGTHFRSLRSTTKQARGRAFYWAEAALDLSEALDGHVELPRPDVPSYPVSGDARTSEIERSAQALREHWSLPEGPVSNVIRLLESRGVVVTLLPLDDRTIDGYSHFQGSRPVVVLTSTKGDAGRARFDAAHEVGHLVCHPDADPGGAQEKQANTFAAEFLMPRVLIARELPRRFDLDAYARLKHKWGVSIQALLYRARELEVITEAAYRRSVMTISRDFGRSAEPYPLPGREHPRLLALAVEVAAQSGVERETLANEAGLTLDDLDSLTAELERRPVVDAYATDQGR